MPSQRRYTHARPGGVFQVNLSRESGPRTGPGRFPLHDVKGQARWASIFGLALVWGCGTTADPPTGPSGSWEVLAAGDRHTCGALHGGTQVWCWGQNTNGQLGNGTTLDQPRPVTFFVPGAVRALALGGSHSCALTVDGSVFCWGRNAEGQLGDGSTTDRSVPGSVSGLGPVAAISAGYQHTCVVERDGRALCWGANNIGQLGMGDAVGPDLCGADPPIPCATGPTPVLNLTQGELIAAGGEPGDSHTCAVETTGRLFCWGSNRERQLGDATLVSRNRPVEVTSVVDVRGVSLGGAHTCVLLGDETVWCWGRRYGDAYPITLMEGVQEVRAGREFDCVRLKDDVLHCWGRNDDGQLGDGSQTDRVIPTTVEDLAAASLALGEAHGCAIDQIGKAWCWGRNAEGQLGATSLLFSALPVPVGN